MIKELTKQIIITCEENNNFERERKITRSCNRMININSENIFSINSLGYFDDTITDYYTVCPHCGYIIPIKEEILPEELKNIAEQKSSEDPLLYRKNELKSQLINLESITSKTKAMARVKTFF